MEKELYTLFYQIEDSHWWSLGVRHIQLQTVRRFLKSTQLKILDVGCGPGGTLRELSQIGNAYGIDTSRYVLSLAKKRGLRNLKVGGMNKIPFKTHMFDGVSAFDVIEHVKNDIAGLKEIKRVLKPGGRLFITTPAYMFLFDDHDRMNHHYRRYEKGELIMKLHAAGFEIEYISFINTFLFPLILLIKQLNKLFGRSKFNNEATAEPFNSILHWIFRSEAIFLPYITFPFGLSLLCVARSPSKRGK